MVFLLWGFSHEGKALKGDKWGVNFGVYIMLPYDAIFGALPIRLIITLGPFKVCKYILFPTVPAATW